MTAIVRDKVVAEKGALFCATLRHLGHGEAAESQRRGHCLSFRGPSIQALASRVGVEAAFRVQGLA